MIRDPLYRVLDEDVAVDAVLEELVAVVVLLEVEVTEDAVLEVELTEDVDVVVVVVIDEVGVVVGVVVRLVVAVVVGVDAEHVPHSTGQCLRAHLLLGPLPTHSAPDTSTHCCSSGVPKHSWGMVVGVVSPHRPHRAGQLRSSRRPAGVWSVQSFSLKCAHMAASGIQLSHSSGASDAPAPAFPAWFTLGWCASAAKRSTTRAHAPHPDCHSRVHRTRRWVHPRLGRGFDRPIALVGHGLRLS